MSFTQFYFITLSISILLIPLIYYRKGYSKIDDFKETMFASIVYSFVPVINILIIGAVIYEEFNVINNRLVNNKKKETEINEFWECVMCDIRMRKGYLIKSKVENQCPICKENSSFLKVEKKVSASDKIIEHKYIKLKDFEKDSLITDIEEQEAKYLEIMKKKLNK